MVPRSIRQHEFNVIRKLRHDTVPVAFVERIEVFIEHRLRRRLPLQLRQLHVVREGGNVHDETGQRKYGKDFSHVSSLGLAAGDAELITSTYALYLPTPHDFR